MSAAIRAGLPGNAIEMAKVASQDDAWLLSLYLRPTGVRGGLGAHAALDNVAIEPAGPEHASLVAVSLHSPADSLDRLDIVLRAEGPAPAAGASYTVRLSGLPALDGLPATACFVLDADAPPGRDPRLTPAAARALSPAAEISYLAKDYASFRKLMFDQMNLLAPEWKERNPADLGVAMIETLAYAADYLSYEQDAVATEAYLGTARRRSSLKRHSRLLGYHVQDGCNARVWVQVEVDANDVLLRAGSVMLSAVKGHAPRLPACPEPALLALQAAGARIFETMHDAILSEPLNIMAFYDGGPAGRTLPQGSLEAILIGHKPLQIGAVVQFEEVASNCAGELAEPDLCHRHTVRLTAVKHELGAGPDQPALTRIAWGHEDALPFPLALSARAANGGTLAPLSVARGNIVLADCGLTLRNQKLAPNDAAPYRPVLAHPGLTYRAPLPQVLPAYSAARLLLQEAARVLPAVTLHSSPGPWEEADARLTWTARRDLLGSDRFARDFTVDSETDGSAALRFGDGQLGRQPVTGDLFLADYRIGSGAACNIGAESLVHIVSTDGRIVKIRNLRAASGGADPENADSIRLMAPGAHLAPARAITARDYAERAGTCGGVLHAAAELRWTGSWHTAFVYVAAQGGAPLDDTLRRRVLHHLLPWRVAGCDVQVLPARYVALDIVLSVHVQHGFFAATVQAALMDLFGTGLRADGEPAMFHPDQLDFGQPLYLSPILAAAAAVQGVQRVDAMRFQRLGQAARGELKAGRIDVAAHQIVRVENDPDAPRHGTIFFHMKGGA